MFPPELSSPVGRFYSGQNILITGATGFIGKVLLRKLLHSFPDIGTIYLLLRSTKDTENISKRIENILKSKLFDDLRSQFPDFPSKIVGIEGDLALPGLGLSPQDFTELTNNVCLVFHSAATVKFNEPLRVATEINVIGTKRLLDLCSLMKRLQAFVHISTAYSNCDKQIIIEEELYHISIVPEKLLELMEWKDDEALELLTPSLLGSYPNTYTWTKAVAEHIVATESLKLSLPVAIVRPSIVVCSSKEPCPGWIDNKAGITFLILGFGFGYITDFLLDKKKIADLIPVDVVVNVLIVAAYHMAITRKQLKIFNCISGSRNSCQWGDFLNNLIEALQQTSFTEPSTLSKAWITTSRLFFNLRTYCFYLLPAFVMDMFSQCTGKKKNHVMKQKKLLDAMDVFYYFTLNDWLFKDDNVQMLETELNEEDKQKFFMNISDLQWKTFIANYIQGIKRFVLHKEAETV